MTKTVEFQPDWVSAPGETIADILEQRKMSETDFARGIGKTREQVRNLLNGRETISEEVAQRLEPVIGGSAAFWIARERSYREGLQRLKVRAQGNAASKWLEELPIKDMTKFGWLPSLEATADKIAACLQYFGVGDISAWREEYKAVLDTAAFRTSPTFESKPGAVAAWFRRGEIESAG